MSIHAWHVVLLLSIAGCTSQPPTTVVYPDTTRQRMWPDATPRIDAGPNSNDDHDANDNDNNNDDNDDNNDASTAEPMDDPMDVEPGDDDATPPPDEDPPSEDSPSDPPDDDGTPTPPPLSPMRGIWIGADEIAALPTSGAAWEHLFATSEQAPGTPNLSDQDQNNNVLVLAKALVFARIGGEERRTAVRAACMAAIGSQAGGRTLALGRELAAYVIAADLVGLTADEDERFRAFLHAVVREELEGRTLISTQEDRPNNWGTHAGASRVAVAAYLGDRAELDRAALVFRGWLGERDAYAEFAYNEPMSWHADPSAPVGINPRGATHEGVSVDGIIPDDMRRGCGFQTPPCPTNYPWGALEGAIVTAEILWRQGYDAWEWGDRALLRAAQALERLAARYPSDGWDAQGDDEWQPWLIAHAYGVELDTALPARWGKNMGFTDWTHDRATRSR